jgi:hypothetical protein
MRAANYLGVNISCRSYTIYSIKIRCVLSSEDHKNPFHLSLKSEGGKCKSGKFYTLFSG